MSYPSIRTRPLCQLFALALGWFALARAACGEPLTLQAALTRAHAVNPRLQARRAEPQVAQGVLKQAQAGPNPIISLSSQGDSNGLGQVIVSYSKELELGGKRQARVSQAEAELHLSQLTVLEAERRLDISVKQAFADLLLAQHLEQLQAEQTQLVERQLQLTRAAVTGGRLPGIEVSRLESEWAETRANLLSARGARRESALVLGRLLGSEDTATVTGILGEDRPVPSLEDLLATQNRPDVQLAEARKAAAERAVIVEQSRGVSNLTLLGGLGYDRLYVPGNRIFPPGAVNFIDDGALGLRFQISFPLPISDTNEGNIEKAEARLSQARCDARALAQEARVELRRAYTAWQMATQARQILAQNSLALREQVLNVLEQAFRIGARNSLELGAARRDLLEVRLQERRAAWRVDSARVQLESAWGGDLP